MKRAFLLAAFLTAFVGCTSYKGGKVTDGTNLEIGIAIPGVEWTINALSYTGGMRVCGDQSTVINVTNRVEEENSYFGVVKTKRNSNMTAAIQPVAVPCKCEGECKCSLR